MAGSPRDLAVRTIIKIVLNAVQDHYDQYVRNTKAPLSRDEYWRRRKRLTLSQTIDDHVQVLASQHIGNALTVTDAMVRVAVSDLKRALDL